MLFFLLKSLSFCSNDNELETYQAKDFEAIKTTDKYCSNETEILNLAYKYRVKNNLSKLITLNVISNVAEDHSDYIVENEKVSHDNFQERMQKLQNNANAQSVDENVAFGYTNAKCAIDGWLNSPDYKRIIETSSFTHFGISMKTDTQERNYFTQIFIKKINTPNYGSFKNRLQIGKIKGYNTIN